MEKLFVANFPLHLGSYREFVNQIINLALTRTSSYVCVAAVHQLVEAHKDRSYTYISHQADLVTPDGMPLTWAIRLLYNIRQERVAGMDLLPDVLSEAEKKGVSVYFYGGTQDLLDKTKVHLQNSYPGLNCAGFYSPPFRLMSEEENELVCNNINASGAQLIFVVLGCPKQERWMALMKNKINATMVGIGAALPVMIGMQKRAPRWMQHSGLEWVYRFFQEPGRLWKRYLVTNTVFIYLLLKEKSRMTFSSSKGCHSFNENYS